MAELFGTDGVRGAVGEVLTAELASSLGRAAVSAAGGERPQVLIVRDTRESGPMLEAALAAGVAAQGGDALLAGVLPTPAASLLTRRLGFDLAAVISASHNPYADNGIKFFGPDGGKLSDAMQSAIESAMESGVEVADSDGGVGRVREIQGASDDYLRELRRAFPLDLSGLRVALDCANGAAFRVAPLIFRELGAEVTELATEPDGRNINDGCGSTHIESLSSEVVEQGLDIGFAFDGDADRVLAVDSKGRVHDGDDLLALIAPVLRERGELGGGVAVTVMTNFGFRGAMEALGIEVVETQVGDRHVAEALADRDWTLGGEQSGHLIWTTFAPTGDGIAASLLTLSALGGRALSEVATFEPLPQRLESVRVADGEAARLMEVLGPAIAEEEESLAGQGRVLVRASGTEPLLRFMVEAPDEAECDRVVGRLLDAARREVGDDA